MLKATLINSFSFTPNFPRFENSLSDLALDVRQVLCTFDPQIEEKDCNPNVETLQCVFRLPYLGNVARWEAVNKVIPYLNPSGWYIFTDTDDVVCQRSLPDLDIMGSDILVASEGLKYGEASFWKKKESYQHLLDQPIYNVGCFAMKYDVFTEFVTYIVQMGRKYPTYTWDDMRFFAEFLKDRKVVEHPTLFGCLYNNLKNGTITKSPENGKYYNTKSGEMICFVHANGNTKEGFL